MKSLPKDAVVHEKTVQAAADNITPIKGRRRRGPNKAPKNGDVVHIRVLPEVWAKALELCGGDPRRIEVVAVDNVLIHNQPR